jgi:hypothetical protein
MSWVGHVALTGDRRGEYRVLVGRPGRKRPLTGPRHRCEDNIKMYLQEIRWANVKYFYRTQDEKKSTGIL